MGGGGQLKGLRVRGSGLEGLGLRAWGVGFRSWIKEGPQKLKPRIRRAESDPEALKPRESSKE